MTITEQNRQLITRALGVAAPGWHVGSSFFCAHPQAEPGHGFAITEPVHVVFAAPDEHEALVDNAPELAAGGFELLWSVDQRGSL